MSTRVCPYCSVSKFIQSYLLKTAYVCRCCIKTLLCKPMDENYWLKFNFHFGKLWVVKRVTYMSKDGNSCTLGGHDVFINWPLEMHKLSIYIYMYICKCLWNRSITCVYNANLKYQRMCLFYKSHWVCTKRTSGEYKVLNISSKYKSVYSKPQANLL